MMCTLGERRNRTTEPIKIDKLVTVVELQNTTNLLNYLQVLILLRVKIVKWCGIIWGSIWKGKIYRDAQIDIASTKDIFKEWMTSFNFDIFKCYITLIFDRMLKDSTRTTFELTECDWATS